MGNWQKIAIALVPLVVVAIVAGFALRQIRTDIVEAPVEPDTNTDFWQVEKIEDAETLLVRRGMERRRVKLCGINPRGTESTREATELIEGSNGEVAIAFLGKQNEAYVGEVWINPEQETEELLNGLLILEGAAIADESEWMLCPNQPSMDAAVQLRGIRP
ncbi:hypothetical protein NG799_21775 [Laspinema sp. D1]|jgi:hypothetical protein|uniref:Uncharacterized protein n=1 Tax=Laspinema palackyanum D2a TaxID=2953684 RepID=A0ABT2MW12_9CYAN|nr:hypothetical protein [Laspinema sp. D2a]